MKRIIIPSLTVSMFVVPLLFSQTQPIQKQTKPYELKQAAQFDSVLVGLQVQRESETQGQQLEDLPDRSQYHSLVIPACAFVPKSSRTDFAFVMREENQFMGALNNLMRMGESKFLAPVNLPHGAKVKSIELGFHDAQNTDNFSPHIELKLIRRKLYRGASGWFEMAVVRSKNIESYWDVVRTDEIINPKVDNNDFGYFLTVKIKGRAQLTLVKISYED